MIIHSWQIQKDKQIIRKQILDEFDNTYPELRNHFFSVFDKIRIEYTDKTKLPDGTHTYEEAIVFPTNADEQPLKKFESSFSSLENNRSQFRINFDKFSSSLILYFESFADFKQDLDVLADLQTHLDLALNGVLRSKSRDDFITSCVKFETINKQLSQKFTFVRTMVVYEKIYNPDGGLSDSFFKVTKGFEVEPFEHK
jgi:hypothetical protein